MPTKTLLPTSTAGSLPKPSWLAEPETLWSPWKLQDEALLEGKQDALRLSLQEQQHAGIDIVSDGEQTSRVRLLVEVKKAAKKSAKKSGKKNGKKSSTRR